MSDKISGGDIARSIKEYHQECEVRLNAEIKRLHELVEAGKEDRKAIDELVDENVRLRGLMRNLVENAEGGDYGEIIVLDVDFIEIEKEVGK